MNTKEEIFHKHYDVKSQGLSDVYAAMDEYAKQQAIAFAEWTDENGYTRIDNGASVRWESWSDLSGKTTEQLYAQFIEHQSQNKGQ